MRTVLPVVPQQEPRPAEGTNQKWQTIRPDANNAPVSSFIDSLQGNDTAFQVVVGQGRLLTTKAPIANEQGVGVIAVGDPTIVDFEVLPNPRMIRVIGRRAGVTDLSITTNDGQNYNFEVHVGYDLELLRARLRQMFPDALLKLGQLREHLVIEGQARSPAQISQILQTIEAYLSSVQVSQSVQGSRNSGGFGTAPTRQPSDGDGGQSPAGDGNPWYTAGEEGSRPSTEANIAAPRIINLLRVPGVQQVMLKVEIAELNRSAMREIGADIKYDDGTTLIQTLLGNVVDATVFGVFDSANLEISLKALRENSLVKVLAEPNLVAMSGHEASFLAGGEYPISVPQTSGLGVNSTTFTVQFKEFGVRLNFLPFVLDDETIRLSVAPEVSEINFSLATVVGQLGNLVPGVTTRRAQTTVEMRQGQTLAIAGLLQVQLDAKTQRIPGLGDLPYIGPLFSNTSHQRVEKELLVLVTPFLVSPMNEGAPCLPGQEVTDPTDCEFYFHNRIEGRSGSDFRSTTAWDNVQLHLLHHEKATVCGPVGLSEIK
jgi:pilus assembly protein CpaC